jgi:hypothetical protein
MTGPDPTRTNSTADSDERSDGQTSSLTVGEENLAALLRATTSITEPEHPSPSVSTAPKAAPVAGPTGSCLTRCEYL